MVDIVVASEGKDGWEEGRLVDAGQLLQAIYKLRLWHALLWTCNWKFRGSSQVNVMYKIIREVYYWIADTHNILQEDSEGRKIPKNTVKANSSIPFHSTLEIQPYATPVLNRWNVPVEWNGGITFYSGTLFSQWDLGDPSSTHKAN